VRHEDIANRREPLRLKRGDLFEQKRREAREARVDDDRRVRAGDEERRLARVDLRPVEERCDEAVAEPVDAVGDLARQGGDRVAQVASCAA
jgi:hypothetical protein